MLKSKFLFKKQLIKFKGKYFGKLKYLRHLKTDKSLHNFKRLIKIIEIINFKHIMWIQHVTEPPSHSENFSQREFNRISKRQPKPLNSNIELGLPLSRDFGDLIANKKREKTKIHME